MSFCVRLISLVLLFSSALAVGTPGQVYVCGEDIIKDIDIRAAVEKGCSRYQGNGGCIGINCLRPNSIPTQYWGNHFPENHDMKIKWPLKINTGFRTTKEIGFVVIDISNDKCSLVGAIYKLKDTSFAVCTGPFTKDSLQRHAELDKSRSGSQRQKQLEPSSFRTPGGTILSE